MRPRFVALIILGGPALLFAVSGVRAVQRQHRVRVDDCPGHTFDSNEIDDIFRAVENLWKTPFKIKSPLASTRCIHRESV